jgi:hypothetical protein
VPSDECSCFAADSEESLLLSLSEESSALSAVKGITMDDLVTSALFVAGDSAALRGLPDWFLTGFGGCSEAAGDGAKSQLIVLRWMAGRLPMVTALLTRLLFRRSFLSKSPANNEASWTDGRGEALLRRRELSAKSGPSPTSKFITLTMLLLADGLV